MSEGKEQISLGRKVIDIESNNLLSNMLDYSSLPYKLKKSAKLWCIVIRDIDTNSITVLKSETGDTISYRALERALEGTTEIIGHNGIKFDLLVLKLFGVMDYQVGYLNEPDILYGNEVKITDTLLRSRLLNPDRKGGHSLNAWGKYLGEYKGDFHEFHRYSEEMLEYCVQDTKVTALIHKKLDKEYQGYIGWHKAEKLENKLADLAVRRETYGFWFDKELAIKCVEDLTIKMQQLSDNVNPQLPPKPLTKTAIKKFTPPANQVKKDGELSSHMIKFALRHSAMIEDDLFIYKGLAREIPFTEPLETHEVADISDLDHVKMHLIDLGWIPSEMKVRDLTKDSKKQSISYEKRVETLDRWLNQTFDDCKYKETRLRELDMGRSKSSIRAKLLPKLDKDNPVRVPTSPCVRVGIEKDLCPNLLVLGDKVSIAKDFTLFLTYKHRKSCIAGGDIDDMDFDEEVPNTGYLSMYREEDGRVSTPAIEIGASTNRYRHIGIANVPRPTSIYGEEMRSLFGSGKGKFQFGFDFSSLEARIQGHYILPFNGEELAAALLAEKPNDIHCYSEDTEILTLDGWKDFGGLSSRDLVAQYDKGSIEFVKPLDYVWEDYSGEMYESDKGFKVTPNHRVHYKQYTSDLECVVEARDFKSSSDKRYLVGANKSGESLVLDKKFVQLIVATQADGYLLKDCSGIKFSFTKNRKVIRMIELLDRLDANYNIKSCFRKGRSETSIYVSSSDLTKKVREFLTVDKEFSSKLLGLRYEVLCVLVKEVAYWDGTTTKNGDVVLDTTCKNSAKFIQTVCSLVGKKSAYSEFTKETAYGSCDLARVYISNNTKAVVSANRKLTVSNYTGKIGCVSVPSGFVLVRRNGRIIISGNTLNATKLGLSRGDAKSISYMLMYGGSYKKAKTMLGIGDNQAKQLVENYWEEVKPLSDLRDAVEKRWSQNGKSYVTGLDGRKINTRSKHSLLNALFQSGGVICAKYATVFLYELLEGLGYKCDPFEFKDIDFISMIEYHDEAQLAVNPKLLPLKLFDTKEEVELFEKEWEGEQLGDNIQIRDGRYCLALPNPISKAVSEAIVLAEKEVNLKVNLGISYVVGNTWALCH